jgi:transposase
LHSVLHAHQIAPPPGRLGSSESPTWWEPLELPAVERLRVQQDRAILPTVARLIAAVDAAVDAEVTRWSRQDPWQALAPFVLHVPGFAVITTMTVLAAIGDITRFPSAKKLVGSSGLGASVHASGQTYHTGAITTQGRRELLHGAGRSRLERCHPPPLPRRPRSSAWSPLWARAKPLWPSPGHRPSAARGGLARLDPAGGGSAR